MQPSLLQQAALRTALALSAVCPGRVSNNHSGNGGPPFQQKAKEFYCSELKKIRSHLSFHTSRFSEDT